MLLHWTRSQLGTEGLKYLEQLYDPAPARQLSEADREAGAPDWWDGDEEAAVSSMNAGRQIGARRG